jgi:hypothetical protein
MRTSIEYVHPSLLKLLDQCWLGLTHSQQPHSSNVMQREALKAKIATLVQTELPLINTSDTPSMPIIEYTVS